MTASTEALRSTVATPLGQGGMLAKLAAGRRVPAFAARLGARLARMTGGPLKFGNTVVAARHADVLEVLARDLDFRIAPINAKRIEAVNGPFVLGMDRGPVLERERRALYAALAAIDLDPIMVAAARDADALLGAAGGAIDAVGGYARLVAGRTATRLFGIAGPDEPLFLDVVRAVFAHTFLNLGDDKAIERRALAAATLMREWFEAEIARRRSSGELGGDMMGMLLRQSRLDDEGVRRTLGGMLVGSIDTTASVVAKALTVMRQDAAQFAGAAREADETEAAWHARLDGWHREALRHWPHNPIVLREAAHATRLGKALVPAGARMFVWTQAAMHDASAFPDPRRIHPRPGDAYLHLGAGLHPCAGRAVNARQIPMLIAKLIERRVRLAGRMQWAGPFPHRMPVTIEGIAA